MSGVCVCVRFDFVNILLLFFFLLTVCIFFYRLFLLIRSFRWARNPRCIFRSECLQWTYQPFIKVIIFTAQRLNVSAYIRYRYRDIEIDTVFVIKSRTNNKEMERFSHWSGRGSITVVETCLNLLRKPVWKTKRTV